MSWLKFNYQTYPAPPDKAFPTRIFIRRPVINIRLLFDDKSIKYPVLIDSGADFCIFHAEIASDILGISVKKGNELTFHGTGGISQKAYFHNIKIDLDGYEYDLYAGFSFEMEKLPYGLLGQTGFFDKFRVIMDYSERRIEISPKKL